MNTETNYRLSSKWTSFGVYASAVAFILILPVIYFFAEGQEFHAGMLMAIVVLFATLALIIYQFVYVASAHVVDNQLILKKQFRPKKVYSFDSIGDVSALENKRTVYVTVKMKNEDGSIEKFLIINGTNFLCYSGRDIEATLVSLRDQYKHNISLQKRY